MEPTADTKTNSHSAELMEKILYEVKRVVVGQDRFLERVMVAMLAQGHLLVEGVPGLAKTLTVKTLANTVRGKFKRIQFTPDLVPADLVGTRIYNQKTGEIGTALGPVFANLLLADEINRAPAKVQSALLEVMQERQVTIAGESHRVPEPFLVMATQNPIETEGTYPLPEAQLDRFMMEIHLDYPAPEQEEEIVMKTTGGAVKLPEAAFDRESFLELRDLVLAVPVPRGVAAYAVRLCGSSRPADPRAGRYVKDYVAWGAGPRGAQNLVLAAKAHALLNGRTAPTVDDVRAVAMPILRHRLIANHRAVGDGVTAPDLVKKLLDEVAA